jgi:hypothetical protein
MTQINGYRIDWTRFVPGGAHSRECCSVRGDLQTVRDYLDAQDVYGREPIVVTEYTQSDQQYGRIVPAGEWDIDPEG